MVGSHRRSGGIVGDGGRGVVGRVAQADRRAVPGHPAPTAVPAHGVPLTTASDAHRLGQVADQAGQLRSILADAGVDTLRGFRSRQPHTIAVGASPAATGQD